MHLTPARHMVDEASWGRGAVGEASWGTGSLAHLKHDDEGQADSQKIPVGRRILPIIFPESLVPAGDQEVSVGSWGSVFSFPDPDSGPSLPEDT